ncbi:MAG: RluA family pseudouridine synthase [Myxococcales bacterium]|nr:RluA family pseudouridine synthase [Myxococcales bacterium]
MASTPPVSVTADKSCRLDVVVTALDGVGSRSRARQFIDAGKVFVDGVAAAPGSSGRILEPGAVVTFEVDRPGTGRGRTDGRRAVHAAGLEILFEDADIVAINKPAGILSDTATREQRENRASVRAAVDRYLKGGGHHAYVVHRIDRDTSGVVLFAKTEEAQTKLKDQFEAHEPARVYWAAVRGTPEPDRGLWADWMRWDGPRKIQELCHATDTGASFARAQYRVTQTLGDVSIIEVSLVTGRRNQIRLQAATRGHPLLGERLYERGGWTPDGVRLGRQALHAYRLTIRHPTTGQEMTFTSPLPQDLDQLVRALKARVASGEVENVRPAAPPPTAKPTARAKPAAGAKPAPKGRPVSRGAARPAAAAPRPKVAGTRVPGTGGGRVTRRDDGDGRPPTSTKGTTRGAPRGRSR